MFLDSEVNYSLEQISCLPETLHKDFEFDLANLCFSYDRHTILKDNYRRLFNTLWSTIQQNGIWNNPKSSETFNLTFTTHVSDLERHFLLLHDTKQLFFINQLSLSVKVSKFL